MNPDFNILNTQGNQIGVIKKSNLLYYNPPEDTEILKQRKQTREYQYVLNSPSNWDGITQKNLNNYNPAVETSNKKLIEESHYREVNFNENPLVFRTYYTE